MGNTNSTKLPISSTVPTPKSVGSMIQDLQEDIKCSICLESFINPVSIDCGHNFCQDCLFIHVNNSPQSEYNCPECRHLCRPERMKPDARLKSLVEKISQFPHLEEVNKKMPTASVVLGQPVQLVGLDENGDLYLDAEALSSCLEQEEVKDTPVCLISIIGEQRQGKSFLLNFLLRRFKNLAVTDDSWMGQEDEPLTGFEWHPGTKSITKGIWMWNQPFLVSDENGKVALFLIDTEGSMDIERSKDNGVKFSAFSMLLSSYQILNLSHRLKDPDLEYMEIFLYIAKTVGHQFQLKPIQHLDVLVRDWFYPPIYGFQGGQDYLQDTIQKLEGQPNRHPRALQIFKSTDTSCYLMPFPGKTLVMGNEGTIAGMDEDFREFLKDYGNHIARSAGMHVQRNQENKPLTGTELADKIKDLSELMKQYHTGFSSPIEMAYTFNQNKNKMFQKKFKKFIQKQDKFSRSVLASLRVPPNSMTRRLKEKQEKLLQQFRDSFQGDEPHRTEFLSCLESYLKCEANDFMEDYNRRFKSSAIKAGVAIGVGAVGLAGGAVGAGIAAALLAGEAIVLGTGATFAIGTVAGASTFGLVGGGVGASVGSRLGNAKSNEAKNEAKGVNEIEEEEEEENVSDEKNLIS
ncbi:RING finger protein 112 isoform X1 [Crotalus tigris]|uniref:RING finger protein 112 isoform X1 n=1 Tax=Crotalus tigris TaxID=88082 RepID=UPI00192F4E6E|nr:RING finger protein 112 isoform X1 [Crotalus tigris]XP_039201778.1 RING finger protein 112 isoform X1 [Crotalus tigris]